MTELEVYTAGYEGETLDQFIDKLKAAGIERVIDAREAPLSRKRGFSKTPLRERLASEGIDYVHTKAVGTPKPWRDEYKRTHDFAVMSGKYDRYLDEHMDAVRLVYDLAREKRSVLICYEAQADRCHRSTLAKRLVRTFSSEQPIRVIDL